MARLLILGSVCASTLAAQVKIQSPLSSDVWIRGDRIDKSRKLDIMISLKNQNMDVLNSEIMAVSHPQSSRYGQHLTKEEVTSLTAPSAEIQSTVASWLKDADVVSVLAPRGDRFLLSASVAQLEALFSTSIHEYSMDEQRVLQASDLYAPEGVAPAIAAVIGLHGTPYVRRSNLESAAGHKVTPSLLKDVYNIKGVDVNRGTKNRRATAEFQGQYTAQSDLSAFFKQYVPDAQPGDEKYTCGPAGGCDPSSDPTGRQGPGVEASLDIQYIAGAAPGIKNEVWSYQAMTWCTDLKNWTSDILDSDEPPQVFSVSYGIQGNVSADKNNGCNPEITMDIEDDFAKIAARGVSILVSSGDGGSGGIALLKKSLWPSWPASAPHVTAVGATMFIDNDPTKGERATTQFGSGGGFDCRWPVQDWQKEATQAYLANSDAGLPLEKDFCRGGRATPDIAALGEGYQVINDGRTRDVGGTSASSPLFASLFSLLNEYRLQKGMSSLGFLNPLIYEMAHAKTGFNDVTVGNNRFGEGRLLIFTEGYSCTEGWDAVTGFGTPNFEEMLAYVKQLPSGLRSDTIV